MYWWERKCHVDFSSVLLRYETNFPYYVAFQNYATVPVLRLSHIFHCFCKTVRDCNIILYILHINQPTRGCCTTTHSWGAEIQIQISINLNDLCNLSQRTTGSVMYTDRTAAVFTKVADGLTSCYLSLNSCNIPVSLTHQAFKATKQKQFQHYTWALVVYKHLISRSRFFPFGPHRWTEL